MYGAEVLPNPTGATVEDGIPTGWIGQTVSYSPDHDAVKLDGGTVFVPAPLVGGIVYEYSVSIEGSDGTRVEVELLGADTDGRHVREVRGGKAGVRAQGARLFTATEDAGLQITADGTIYVRASVQGVPPWQGGLPTFEVGGVMLGGDPNPIQVAKFEPSWPELRTQDVERDTGDGALVGRDYFGSSSWSFEIFTNATDYGEALALAGQVAKVWTGDMVRTTPGAVLPLRYHMSGRWRRVYGRPRRYAGPDGGVATMQGKADITADFMIVDHLFYDDTEQQIEVGTVPSSVGGFIFPLIFPLTTARRTAMSRTGQFQVGGVAPTWPVITIQGPISDPEVSVGDWSLRLVGHIAYDRSVTVDTSPWARTVTRSDGASVAGMLHSSARLGEMRLDPGFHELSLTGKDSTGTARARIAWRDAYYSL